MLSRRTGLSFVLAAALLSGAGTASADGQGYAPAYAAPALFSWTGFYVGANVGGAWGAFDVDTVANPAFFAGAGPDTLTSLHRDGSPTFSPSSFVGGGQLGYNWQMSNVVVGLETDIQGWNLRESHNTGVLPTPPLSPGLGAYQFAESASSSWLWTLRGRTGLAFGNGLAYVTGGLAVADHSFSQSYFFFIPAAGGGGSASTDQAGWTIGGGLEYALRSNWTVKAEYLYVDLGSQSFGSNVAGYPAATFHHEDTLTANIVRIGINYKFGSRDEYAPLK